MQLPSMPSLPATATQRERGEGSQPGRNGGRSYFGAQTSRTLPPVDVASRSGSCSSSSSSEFGGETEKRIRAAQRYSDKFILSLAYENETTTLSPPLFSLCQTCTQSCCSSGRSGKTSCGGRSSRVSPHLCGALGSEDKPLTPFPCVHSRSVSRNVIWKRWWRRRRWRRQLRRWWLPPPPVFASGAQSPSSGSSTSSRSVSVSFMMAVLLNCLHPLDNTLIGSAPRVQLNLLQGAHKETGKRTDRRERWLQNTARETIKVMKAIVCM
jgi:hypothetical protein